MNKRAKGNYFEEKAEQFLINQGYTIREKNYRIRKAEIDLIVENDNTIVFVEVKYRKTSKYGYAQEAVNRKKQQKIFLAAEFYIAANNLNNSNIRFDIISINNNKLDWIQDGFWGDDFGI